ncbi:MAG TPA: DUF2269 domain-containing protein [Permianibacter sp.]|nr:DUF2269 domain-containing protein [Permianibacter sp.]
MLIETLRWLHIIGACVLLGTGAGIAFFMWMAHRSRDAPFVARTAEVVVIADFMFTASAVVLQPVTGVLLARSLGWPLDQGWLLLSILLYVFTGCCWLPVVWMQMRMRDLARQAMAQRKELPPEYQRLFARWIALGIPAFAAVLMIVWLMVNKPQIGIAL